MSTQSVQFGLFPQHSPLLEVEAESAILLPAELASNLRILLRKPAVSPASKVSAFLTLIEEEREPLSTVQAEFLLNLLASFLETVPSADQRKRICDLWLNRFSGEMGLLKSFLNKVVSIAPQEWLESALEAFNVYCRQSHSAQENVFAGDFLLEFLNAIDIQKNENMPCSRVELAVLQTMLTSPHFDLSCQIDFIASQILFGRISKEVAKSLCVELGKKFSHFLCAHANSKDIAARLPPSTVLRLTAAYVCAASEKEAEIHALVEKAPSGTFPLVSSLKLYLYSYAEHPFKTEDFALWSERAAVGDALGWFGDCCDGCRIFDYLLNSIDEERENQTILREKIFYFLADEIQANSSHLPKDKIPVLLQKLLEYYIPVTSGEDLGLKRVLGVALEGLYLLESPSEELIESEEGLNVIKILAPHCQTETSAQTLQNLFIELSQHQRLTPEDLKRAGFCASCLLFANLTGSHQPTKEKTVSNCVIFFLSCLPALNPEYFAFILDFVFANASRAQERLLQQMDVSKVTLETLMEAVKRVRQESLSPTRKQMLLSLVIRRFEGEVIYDRRHINGILLQDLLRWIQEDTTGEVIQVQETVNIKPIQGGYVFESEELVTASQSIFSVFVNRHKGALLALLLASFHVKLRAAFSTRNIQWKRGSSEFIAHYIPPLFELQKTFAKALSLHPRTQKMILENWQKECEQEANLSAHLVQRRKAIPVRLNLKEDMLALAEYFKKKVLET